MADDEKRCPCGLHDREFFTPLCPIFQSAQKAIAIWEADPKRQFLAKELKLHPGQVSDEMIQRMLTPQGKIRSPGGFRVYAPNMQQIPREKKS